MKLPETFLQSLEGLPGFDREAFTNVHQSGNGVTSVRLNNARLREEKDAENLLAGQPSWPPSVQLTTVPWCGSGRYLSQRPSFTFDPLFHAGCYYVQEASSMFLEQAFRQLLPLGEPLNVLDLCAAPGGKSTHIQSLLSPESLLVSNEVIKSRAAVLTDNVIKWGASNVIVTANDPKAFQKLPGYFDALVVDAPCSGSGLFRKDPEAISEWSTGNVALCSGRQQRILADALPALKEGGVLIYSTCSYSAAEDEAIADWLIDETGMESLPLSTRGFEGIVCSASSATGAEGYRFYPDKLKGEGFFLACFRKTETSGVFKRKPSKAETVSAKEKALLREWIAVENNDAFRWGNEIIVAPSQVTEAFSELRNVLSVQYAGTKAGSFLRDKFIPHHALSQSLSVSPAVPYQQLDYDDAVAYLQRRDVRLSFKTPGWQTVRYNGFNLGWVNALANRVNNYYPKELRILKARPGTFFPDL